MSWSLPELLKGLHDDILAKLSTARSAIGHPTDKGDASEGVWIELLNKYLPKRYETLKAHVCDSQGQFSEQMDVVIIDRQYTPFIFDFRETKVVPSESVYAVFESKQELSRDNILYAQKKIRSVRSLHRTSLPIPYAGGVYEAKSAIKIIGGLLAFVSSYSPSFGPAAENALDEDRDAGRLEIGCIADSGVFLFNESAGFYDFRESGKAATMFLLELIAQLQTSGTVPMIDVRAYAEWLDR